MPHSRIVPLSRGLLVFALVSLLGNEVGSLLRYPNIGAAVLFPPYAALTVALVVSPRRDWVWYILVGAATHFIAHWPHWSLSWVLLADVANVARAVSAAMMLHWLFGGLPDLDSVDALALFVVSAVLVAPAVGATAGAANVVLHDPSRLYWRTWSGWFMSNALTGLTLLPAFLLAVTNAATWRRERIARRRVAEALLLASLLGLTCWVSFLSDVARHWPPALLVYAPLPALVWAALRFGTGGASLALSAVASVAIWGADRGSGPFLASSPDGNVLAVQLFVLLTTLPVLCLAAVAAARRRAVGLYGALLASLQDHVAILDARGVVLEANGSWRRFTDTADVDSFHHVQPGDNCLDACRSAAAAGDSTAVRVLAGMTSVLSRDQRQFEVEYDCNQDGRQERYAMSVEALERSDGGAVVRRANVTARRQAEMELEEQRRALFHLARVAVLGQLSGALAHELSQPLASILSNADAARNLLRRQPPDLVEVSAILDDIAGEDRRAAQVIQRLRALLKRGEMRVQALNLGEVVNEVLELSRAELNMRGVSATAALEPNLPLVLGDRVQLQQVLLNLILNACEAMKTTLEPDRTILLSVRADAKRCVRVAVRDHGTGISPEVIDRLFEPFVTTKPEGLGLGLAISRTIVMAHGGRLWAENNADRGATVHCVLSYDDTHAASHGGSPGTQRSTVERLADTGRSQEPLAGLSSVSNLPRLPRGAAQTFKRGDLSL